MTEITVRMVPSEWVGPIPATRSHFVYKILTLPKFVTLMSLNMRYNVNRYYGNAYLPCSRSHHHDLKPLEYQ